MSPSSTTPERKAAKARVRAKLYAPGQMAVRQYLANLLTATHSHAEAEEILETFERQSGTAARLNRVMDICDRAVRDGEELVDVDCVHAAALGDDVRQSGGVR